MPVNLPLESALKSNIYCECESSLGRIESCAKTTTPAEIYCEELKWTTGIVLFPSFLYITLIILIYTEKNSCTGWVHTSMQMNQKKEEDDSSFSPTPKSTNQAKQFRPQLLATEQSAGWSGRVGFLKHMEKMKKPHAVVKSTHTRPRIALFKL